MLPFPFKVSVFSLDTTNSDSITRKIRLRIQVKQCKTNAKIASNFRRDLRSLISKDVCSAPCEIQAVTLRCRIRKKVNILQTNFEIKMDPNIIFSRGQCNSSCVKCETERKLQKIISNLKRLVNSDKFVLPFDGQKYLLERKHVKGMRSRGRCKKTSRKGSKISRYTFCSVAKIFIHFEVE